MCGIAGVFLKDSFRGQYDLEDLVDGLFLGIESRGRDAAGILTATKDGEVELTKDNITAQHFILTRPLLPQNMRFSMLHTRLGTKGSEEFMENNHPVNYGTVYVTHNGVIRNDDELFEKDDLLKDVERAAEVDSIVVPTLLAQCGMSKALDTLKDKLEGSWALAIHDTTVPDEVLLVRGKSSPLWVLNHPKLVMWASTKSALEDAWKLAIGTPPKYNKYDSVDEGCFVRIKGGGLVETGRFMERPTYSSGFHRTNSSPGTTRSYPGTSDSRPMCFECGANTALYKIIDSYRDEQNGRSVEWDVPVCFKCRETLASDLTYAHAGESKLRVRYRRDDDVCELCQREPAGWSGKEGARLCSGCWNDEKSGWKHVASFKGDDPRGDEFLTLRPGDLIPYEMRSAFKGCESCESNMVAYIGNDGFAICGLCRIAEEGEGGGIDCLQCDNCEVWFPVKQIRIQSAFGTVCEDCCNEEGWTPENTHMPEDDEHDPEIHQAALFQAEKKPDFLGYIREADERYPEGTNFMPSERATAQELKLHLPFVAWLLHCCTSDHLIDPALTEVWDKVTMTYTQILAANRTMG